MGTLAVCSGEWVQVAGGGKVTCDGVVSLLDVSQLTVLIEQAQTAAAFTISQLDPATMTAAFGTGYFLVAFFHVLGKGTAAVLSLLK